MASKMDTWQVPEKYELYFRILAVLFSLGIIAILLFYILGSQHKIFALIFLIIVLVFFWRKRMWGFYTFVFLLPMSFHLSPYIQRYPVPLADLLLYILFLYWFIDILTAKKIEFARTSLNIPLIIFSLLIFISIFPSLPEIFSFLKSAGSGAILSDTYYLVTEGSVYLIYSLIALIHMLVSALLYFYIVNHNLKERRIVKTLMFSYIFIVLVGLIGYLIPSLKEITKYFLSIDNLSYKGRVFSTFRNPNVLGEYLAMTIPLIIGVAFWVKNNKHKIAMGVLVVLGLAALYLTASRGAWLGFVFGLMFFAAMKVKSLKKNRVKIGIGIVVLLILLSSPVSYYLLTQRSLTADLSGRLPIWQDSVKMIRKNPIIGAGVGSFIREHKELLTSEGPVPILHAHNLFLNIALESGIIALIAFIWLLIVLFWPIIRDEHSDLKYGLAAGLFALLVHSLVEYVFFYQEITILFFIYIALVVKHGTHKKNK